MENMLPSAKEQFRLFLENPILLACIFSWFSAQFIKTVINLIYGRVKTFGEPLSLGVPLRFCYFR